MEAARGLGSLTSSGVWGNDGPLFTARLAGGVDRRGARCQGCCGMGGWGAGVQGAEGKRTATGYPLPVFLVFLRPVFMAGSRCNISPAAVLPSHTPHTSIPFPTEFRFCPPPMFLLHLEHKLRIFSFLFPSPCLFFFSS